MNGTGANILTACREALGRRDGPASLPLARRIVAAHPKAAEGYNLLGLAEHFSGNFDAAETAFLRALELGGPDGGTLSNLGILYMGWKRHSDAVQTFIRAVSLLDRDAHMALFNRAQCYMELRRPEAAIEALQKAVSLRPGYLKGWKELGLAWRRKAERSRDPADIDAAIACYDRIASAARDYPLLDAAIAATLGIRAEIELDRGDTAAAVQSCVRANSVAKLPTRELIVLHNDTIDGLAEEKTAEFKDAIVLPGSREWFVVDGERFYGRGMASTHPATSPYVEASGTTLSIAHIPEPDVTIAEECFLLGGSENYYHWLIDYLPRLAVYARHERYESIRLLTSDAPSPYQTQSLQMLGIDEARLIRIPDALTRPQAIRCERLYAAPIQLDGLRLKPAARDWLRRALGGSTGNPGSAGDRRLYISRWDARVRRVLNEDAVAEFLRSRGFEIIAPGTMPLADQIAAFAGAGIVVGAHGAGLANMVFAPPGARIVELMGSSAFQQSFMHRLAESCGHRFDRVFCQARATDDQRARSHDEDFDMVVSLDDLDKILTH